MDEAVTSVAKSNRSGVRPEMDPLPHTRSRVLRSDLERPTNMATLQILAGRHKYGRSHVDDDDDDDSGVCVTQVCVFLHALHWMS